VPTRVQVMFSGAQPATQPDVTVALLDVQLPAEVSQIHIPIGMGDLNIAADCVQRGVAIHLGDLHILLYVTGGEIAMNELNLQRSGVAEGGVAMNRANLERAVNAAHRQATVDRCNARPDGAATLDDQIAHDRLDLQLAADAFDYGIALDCADDQAGARR